MSRGRGSGRGEENLPGRGIWCRGPVPAQPYHFPFNCLFKSTFFGIIMNLVIYIASTVQKMKKENINFSNYVLIFGKFFLLNQCKSRHTARAHHISYSVQVSAGPYYLLPPNSTCANCAPYIWFLCDCIVAINLFAGFTLKLQCHRCILAVFQFTKMLASLAHFVCL